MTTVFIPFAKEDGVVFITNNILPVKLGAAILNNEIITVVSLMNSFIGTIRDQLRRLGEQGPKLKYQNRFC